MKAKEKPPIGGLFVCRWILSKGPDFGLSRIPDYPGFGTSSVLGLCGRMVQLDPPASGVPPAVPSPLSRDHVPNLSGLAVLDIPGTANMPKESLDVGKLL